MLCVCTVPQCCASRHNQNPISNVNRVIPIIAQFLTRTLNLPLSLLRIRSRTLLRSAIFVLSIISKLASLLFAVLGGFRGLISGLLQVLGRFFRCLLGCFGGLLRGDVGGFLGFRLDVLGVDIGEGGGGRVVDGGGAGAWLEGPEGMLVFGILMI